VSLAQRIKKGKVGFYPGKIKLIIAPSDHKKAVEVLKELECPSQNRDRRQKSRRFRKWKSKEVKLAEKKCRGSIRENKVELVIAKNPFAVVRKRNLKVDETLLILSRGVKGAGCFSMKPDSVFTNGDARAGKLKSHFCWVVGIFTDSLLTIRNAADQIAYNYFENRSCKPGLPWVN